MPDALGMSSPAEAITPLISIVILTYNSANYIDACLGSIARSTRKPDEIIVTDNASTDESAKRTRESAEKHGLDVRVAALDSNLGCAGGNNAGWRLTSGNYVVFLNPDAEIVPDFLDEILAPMERDERVGVTGAKIYYPETRRLQHAGGRIFPNGMTIHFGAGQIDQGGFDQESDMDYVTGAAFAVRREVLERLDGFDEDFYPAYYEETDLCTRARRSGWRVVYCPRAIAWHHESVSLTANSPGFRRLYQRMRIRYCMKNLSKREWLTRFVPFELKWMCSNPHARGHRLEQFRAYAENISWWLKTRKKAEQPKPGEA